MSNLDTFDTRILAELQRDALCPMDTLADRVHLSRNACWRRIKRMEAEGVIQGRVAVLNPEKLGCPLTAIVLIRASAHDPGWRDTFERAVRAMPEITGAHRMTGDLDYVLKVRIGDVAAYDRFYKDLTARVPVLDISASFVMQDLKDTTALPLPDPG
ncbi:MAG: Lrp/AsnC family transcriptional regulator [Rhodobacter sp.]|nr:Lrp/AsnC family transcriptional regulator [Rhodobacter sp.]